MDVLQKTVPIRSLSEASLEKIITAMQIYHINTDEGGDDSKAIYMLRGAVMPSPRSQTEPRIITSNRDGPAMQLRN